MTNEVKPLNMDIVDRGVMFVKNPVEQVKYHRITKQELHDFVRWMFIHVDDEGWSTMSDARVSNLYFQETGKHVNRTTVSRNRDNWFIKEGKIVRYAG